MSFLTFKETENPGKKTKRWTIYSTGGDFLGWVVFHAPWRKYVWAMANVNVIFDVACTQEVVDFLKLHKDDRQ